MPHKYLNIRLQFSPLKQTFFSSFLPVFCKSSSRNYSLFTGISSSKLRRKLNLSDYCLNLGRRSSGILKESRSRVNKVSMESTGTSSGVGFNKRRAEGTDGSDKPKRNPQLKKARSLHPTNTLAYVQILGTGMDTQDTSPSVLLFFDKLRFIFNAGEGLQRFCTEHKIKLSKIDHVFLSRVCSETAGGLPGLLLTLAGLGEEGMSVNVWGPSDLNYLVDAMSSFIPHASIVNAHSFGPAPRSNNAVVPHAIKFGEPIVLLNDEVVKISAIPLRSRCIESSAIKPGEISVIYICELPEQVGKFDPKKAASLGLKAGRKFGELQSGKSVKSDLLDIMVHPSDVMGPSIPGPIVFLVDCPTESHVQELLSTESLHSYYADFPNKSAENTKSVTCIIHLSPSSVISSRNYQNWMKKFGSSQHIIAGHEMKNMKIPILKGSAKIVARLNYLCPQFFPAPGLWPDSNSSIKVPISELCESTPAENLLKFTLRPHAHLGVDRSCIPDLLTSSGVTDELLLEIPEIVDAAQQIRLLLDEQDTELMYEETFGENALPNCLENIRRDDLEIVLLGTGSSQPSKYRNVSSIYVNLFSNGSMLLDCGEGTLGQLKRRYGVQGGDIAVKNLRCIWISHIHADHHAGLARILSLRCNLLKGVPHEPLIVIGPRQLKRFLDAYQRLEDLDMQFIDCRSTTESSWHSFVDVVESNMDCSPQESQVLSRDMNNKNAANPNEGNIFAGGPMESFQKRSTTPFENGSVSSSLKILKEVLHEAGLEAMISFPVVHCPQAFGVVLRAAERKNSVGKVIPGWKVVYSGDTRPCPELIEASHGATILIHEATFEDGMEDEAIAKNHSTTTEALEMGSSAGVYRIILTHFSQRYPKIPVVDDAHMHKACIAFDLMSINIADLTLLPKVVPYLKLLFRNEIADADTDDVIEAETI